MSPCRKFSLVHILLALALVLLVGVAIVTVWNLFIVHTIIIPCNGDGNGGDGCCTDLTARLVVIDDKLDELLIFGRNECHPVSGILNVEDRFPEINALYDQIIRFDNIRGTPDLTDPTRTNITYFPGLPGVSPTNNLPVLVGNVFDHDRFELFQATPFSVNFFFGVNPFNVSSTSRRIAAADRNVQDHGPDNLEQRRIMAALTKNKIVCRYNDRVLTFVNNVYDSWVVHREPVLSSFKDHLIEYYLDIHLGTDKRPDFVRKYFNDWLFFIATIDDDATAAVRTKTAFLTNPCVREYFEARILDVIDEGKTDTITYHWIKSGMPLESAVTEAIRAITSFGPLVNAVNLIVNQSIIPTVAAGACGRTFLELFTLASNGVGRAFTAGCAAEVVYPGGNAEQLSINVVREFLRILVPDNLLVSTDQETGCVGPTCSIHTQARHVPQLIEIRAEYDRAGLVTPWTPAPIAAGFISARNIFGFYNPTKYVASFTAAYSDAVCNETCSACLSPTDKTPGLLSIINSFTKSAVDSETPLPPGEGNLIPVFPQPIYAPFGLGSTRNAYEILIQYTLLRLFDTIKCLQFVNVCQLDPGSPLCDPTDPSFTDSLIPLAPLLAVPDAFFVNPTTPIRPGCA